MYSIAVLMSLTFTSPLSYLYSCSYLDTKFLVILETTTWHSGTRIEYASRGPLAHGARSALTATAGSQRAKEPKRGSARFIYVNDLAASGPPRNFQRHLARDINTVWQLRQLNFVNANTSAKEIEVTVDCTIITVNFSHGKSIVSICTAALNCSQFLFVSMVSSFNQRGQS